MVKLGNHIQREIENSCRKNTFKEFSSDFFYFHFISLFSYLNRDIRFISLFKFATLWALVKSLIRFAVIKKKSSQRQQKATHSIQQSRSNTYLKWMVEHEEITQRHKNSKIYDKHNRTRRAFRHRVNVACHTHVTCVDFTFHASERARARKEGANTRNGYCRTCRQF